ncbi:DUF732 domain-containing protein [Mycobacterium manitobense]|uniref:DUF732 domain-containing protein n=1 Tax=[Mycobacterium] manitobense TaxID=190147 RepID=A0A9X2YS39_9MYCO|nr:DUF732 domain-containing protein [[Mycobacterium] manitobense]MCV7172391.1 DUF732 domain-containing protein [[Mycobacterium] manitobense]
MRNVATVVAATAVMGVGVTTAGPAGADAVGYLVNVTVRPGYNFPNADAALAYGRGICDEIAAHRPYAQIIADIRADFRSTDEYQAAYLVNQAAGELCPAQIWQLRNSAAHYRPPQP